MNTLMMGVILMAASGAELQAEAVQLRATIKEAQARLMVVELLIEKEAIKDVEKKIVAELAVVQESKAKIAKLVSLSEISYEVVGGRMVARWTITNKSGRMIKSVRVQPHQKGTGRMRGGISKKNLAPGAVVNAETIGLLTSITITSVTLQDSIDMDKLTTIRYDPRRVIELKKRLEGIGL